MVQPTTCSRLVSHNWITSRWLKYSALALHFNYRVACLVSVVLTVALAIWSFYVALPKFMLHGEPYERGCLACVVCPPTFFIVLRFFRDVCPPRWSPSVFWDTHKDKTHHNNRKHNYNEKHKSNSTDSSNSHASRRLLRVGT